MGFGPGNIPRLISRLTVLQGGPAEEHTARARKPSKGAVREGGIVLQPVRLVSGGRREEHKARCVSGESEQAGGMEGSKRPGFHLVADEQVAAALLPEAVRVQPEGLVRDDHHLGTGKARNGENKWREGHFLCMWRAKSRHQQPDKYMAIDLGFTWYLDPGERNCWTESTTSPRVLSAIASVRNLPCRGGCSFRVRADTAEQNVGRRGDGMGGGRRASLSPPFKKAARLALSHFWHSCSQLATRDVGQTTRARRPRGGPAAFIDCMRTVQRREMAWRVLPVRRVCGGEGVEGRGDSETGARGETASAREG